MIHAISFMLVIALMGLRNPKGRNLYMLISSFSPILLIVIGLISGNAKIHPYAYLFYCVSIVVFGAIFAPKKISKKVRLASKAA